MTAIERKIIQALRAGWRLHSDGFKKHSLWGGKRVFGIPASEFSVLNSTVEKMKDAGLIGIRVSGAQTAWVVLEDWNKKHVTEVASP